MRAANADMGHLLLLSVCFTLHGAGCREAWPRFMCAAAGEDRPARPWQACL